MSWYRNPLLWVGIGVAAVGMINRRRYSTLGLAPRGGSILPPGLLSRKHQDEPSSVVEPFDTEDAPPPEMDAPHESVPPPLTPPEDMPDSDFDIAPKKTRRLTASRLCHTARLARTDPDRFCEVFCKDAGWQAGHCEQDKCVCDRQ